MTLERSPVETRSRGLSSIAEQAGVPEVVDRGVAASLEDSSGTNSVGPVTTGTPALTAEPRVDAEPEANTGAADLCKRTWVVLPVDTEQNEPADDLHSIAGSSCSGADSSVSKSSNAQRVSFMMRKAKREAEEAAYFAQIKLEDEQRKLRLEAEERERKSRIEDESRQVEFQRRKKMLEFRKLRMENEIIERELNKMGIGDASVQSAIVGPGCKFREGASSCAGGDAFSSANGHKGGLEIREDPDRISNLLGAAPSRLSHIGDGERDEGFVKVEGSSGENISTDVARTLSSISKGMLTLAQQARMPPPEPQVFSGSNIEEYVSFKLSFLHAVDVNGCAAHDKYSYLLRYTSGRARDIVRSCFSRNPEAAYDLAMSSLDRLYGDDYELAQKFLADLRSWPMLTPDNLKEKLNDLYFFLLKVDNMKTQGWEFQQLDQHSELRIVVDKFPTYMVVAWRDLVADARERGRNVGFRDLVEFVGKQVRKESLPIFGEIKRRRENQSEVEKRAMSISFQSKGLRELDEIRKGEYKSNAWRTDARSHVRRGVHGPLCEVCGSLHELSSCDEFSRMEHGEKINVLYSLKRCYRCLFPGHNSRKCEARVRCSICRSDKHLDVLHKNVTVHSAVSNGDHLGDEMESSQSPGNVDEPNAGHRALNTVGNSKRIMSPAIPVKIRKCGGPWIKTYAALDSWASGGFISGDLADKLDVVGPSRELKLSTMMGVNQNFVTREVAGLEISSLDSCEETYQLNVLHRADNWPFQKIDVPNYRNLQGCPHLSGLNWSFLDCDIGILLGNDHPGLVKTLEVVSGEETEPYATRHALGWALNGPVMGSVGLHQFCHFIRQTTNLENGLETLYRQEFLDPNPGKRGRSVEDAVWQERIDRSFKQRKDGYLEIALPLRNENVSMPYNRGQAMASLLKLKRKLLGNCKLKCDYSSFMQGLSDKGHLEVVPTGELLSGPPGKCWYLVHHAVYHKVKAKIRVVFDCSRKSAGVSLNEELMAGPDLLNSLVGVLLRFRRGLFAFAGDIEQMFMQLKVPKEHSNLMRVLWWENGDMNTRPVDYRLTSHTFGAVSSPSVANFAVRSVASRVIEGEMSDAAVETLQRCAYMDDIMNSFDSPVCAAKVLNEVSNALAKVKFNLTGIISNSHVVIDSVNRSNRAEQVREIDLEGDLAVHDRVLGLLWFVEQDCFMFRPRVTDTTCTRRAILSIVGGIYDPLGFIGPVVVSARSIFQEACRLKLSWDEQLPENLRRRWVKWVGGLSDLDGFSVPRCIGGFENGKERVELHIFCDGSTTAYATVAFARSVSTIGEVKCILLMSKSRQVPVSGGALTTIPRIELSAAKLGVNLALLIKEEMPSIFESEYYWTDSQIVLRYIRSVTGRFQRFVENRVNYIVEHSSREAWRYVPGDLNVADICSRGITVSSFMKRRDWVQGPQFLQLPTFVNHGEPIVNSIALPELRVVVTRNNEDSNYTVDKLLNSSSDWKRVLMRVAVFLVLKACLRGKEWPKMQFSAALIAEAEFAIWAYVQGASYQNQIDTLRCSGSLKRADKLFRLSPFVDEKGFLRVGGRLGHSDENYETKHPLVLPSQSTVVKAMIHSVHVSVGHFGVSYLEAMINERYHVVGLRPILKQIVNNCVLCCKMNGRPVEPRMADLPAVRVDPAPKAFDRIGVDFFGPFFVSQGRSSKKIWGVVYTCLASRAIHLDLADSLDTGSFLNSFRRFVARRGKCTVAYSDNGTNFVGAVREMKLFLDGWDRDKICRQAAIEGITWNFSPPRASHYGGAWEREIRSVRKVLWGLMGQSKKTLNREELYTLFCEVESILNARPLAPLVAGSVECGPLTPNHALFTKTHDLPIGIFEEGDAYVRKRWRYVQFLADTFWKRWRKEYVRTLKLRSKWTRDRVNLAVGDLVLIVDGMVSRSQWPTALVTRVLPGDDGVVRRVEVKTAGCSESGRGGISLMERAVHKLIPIMRVGS